MNTQSFNASKYINQRVFSTLLVFTLLLVPLVASAAPGGTECNDGRDNDTDSYVDLDDPQCTSKLDDSEGQASACGNSIDDDNDGLTDFPNDPACDNPADDQEAPKNNVSECDDGKNNSDDDSLIDYAVDDSGDPDCDSFNDDDESQSDGVDGCTDGAFNELTDPVGNESPPVEDSVKYQNAGYQVNVRLLDVDEKNVGGIKVPTQIELEVDGNQDGTYKSKTVDVSYFKYNKVTIDGRDFQLTDDPKDGDKYAIYDDGGDWVMDIKHFACGGDPNATDDGPIDVDQCADSGGKIIDVLANDSDPDNDDLQITSIVTQPSQGSVSIINGGNKVEYTPPSNYTGTTTFKYEVGDGNGGTDTAVVEVNVTDSGCNSDPNTNDDGTSSDPICVSPSSPTDINVFANDSDPDGDDLTVTEIEGTSVSDGDTYPYLANGAVTVVDASAGKLRYIPSTNNAQSFTYTASDGNGNTDQATVYVDPGSCGELTVRVEGPGGNLVPGATFAPKYDSNANGNIGGNEQLPEKGSSTGKFTYNVQVSDTPRLSKMNESLMQNIPAGYATSVDSFDKQVEKVIINGNTKDEPDDFWYGNKYDTNQSKLATNASTTGGGGGDNPPTAVLECEGSQDQTFVNNCQSQYGQDAFAANFIGDNSTDPDGDIDTYDWQSQSGSIDQTTNEPVDDIQYCVNTADQGDVQDNLELTVTDTQGNSDSDVKEIGDMCPIGGGGGCTEVSVQSDFTGDSLDTNSSAERGANDQSYSSFDNGPKTATLDVGSILDPGETAGDLTISFTDSVNPPNGFTAEVDCDGGVSPEQCGANAEIHRDDTGTQLRRISVTGDPNPIDEVHDTSDVTTNVSAGDTVELRTDTDAVISQNHNSEASAEIMIEDITLEVCN